MNWKPNKILGAFIGGFIVLVLTGIGLFLFTATIRQPFGFSFYLTGLCLVFCLPVWCAVLFWLYGLLTLSYQLDRSQLVIRCGLSRRVIALSSVTGLVAGETMAPIREFRGIGWPGYLHGTYQLQDGTHVTVHSTEPLDRQLVVVTPQGSYGISPADTEAFLNAMRLMLSEGATRIVAEGYTRSAVMAWPVWTDRRFWSGVVVCLCVNLALWGLVASLYNTLPGRLPLQFDPRGQVELIGAKSGLLVVPAIGSLVLLTNGLLGLFLHKRERFAVSMLQSVSFLLQITSWIAVLRIIG